MKAVVLAAGYATRLRPLTDTVAKPLLPLAGRPLLDYVLDRIDAVRDVQAAHVVTNTRFADDFRHWASRRDGRLAVTVHDDGTTSNDDRLGAIGDLRFTIDAAGLHDDDLLVVAGDNLFDFGLAEFVAFWRGKADGSAIAVRQIGDPALLRQYSVLDVDAQDRVISFVEKPEEPHGTLAGVAIYILNREHVELVQVYLAAGNTPDQPGRFFAWLSAREPLYAYRFGGEWLDVGDRNQLLGADNLMRRRAGLPSRDEYFVD